MFSLLRVFLIAKESDNHMIVAFLLHVIHTY